jgi:hypothetical protein
VNELRTQEIQGLNMPSKTPKAVAPKPVRKCGTPGCNLPDYHPGICESLAPARKRDPVNYTLKPAPKPPPRPAAMPRLKRRVAVLKPAEQSILPNGLHRFYHVHRWGVPLPDGPVDCTAGSDDEVDESWRLEAPARRTRARTDVPSGDATLAQLWNAHVRSLPPLVSDRMVPGACRQFARAHAKVLAKELRLSFASHLAVLCEHNLLHNDDAEDCVLIVDALAAASRSSAESGLRSDSAEDGPSLLPTALCAECSRPLHGKRCVSFGRARGAATWPLQQTLAAADR